MRHLFETDRMVIMNGELFDQGTKKNITEKEYY